MKLTKPIFRKAEKLLACRYPRRNKNRKYSQGTCPNKNSKEQRLTWWTGKEEISLVSRLQNFRASSHNGKTVMKFLDIYTNSKILGDVVTVYIR